MLSRSAIISRLRQWTSCDIADGLLRLKVPHGGFLDGISLYSPRFQAGPTKVVGQVYTVKFVLRNNVEAPKLTGHYMDRVPEGAVVFLSQPVPHVNAVFGGLMALRAKQLGAAGAVVDGRLRDLQEHRDLEFPVFARAVSTTAGGEVCRASEVEVPVKLNLLHQERWINSGDYIIADLNGVVCVPKELAKEVLDVVPGIVEADKRCAEGIKQGRTIEEVFREYRGL